MSEIMVSAHSISMINFEIRELKHNIAELYRFINNFNVRIDSLEKRISKLEHEGVAEVKEEPFKVGDWVKDDSGFRFMIVQEYGGPYRLANLDSGNVYFNIKDLNDLHKDYKKIPKTI